MTVLQTLAQETTSELQRHIYPFWSGLKDERGGFYGCVGFDGDVNRDGGKGVILNSRILWFFSNVYLTYRMEEALPLARHAYEFLRDACLDPEQGGVYWMIGPDNKPLDDMKHTYSQSFAVYGLSSYYRASGNREALQLAYTLFDLIETECMDEYGYMEAFDRRWNPIFNEKLSEDGFKADKTMNTLLHVIEAYTELYLADRSPAVSTALKKALDLYRTRIYHPESQTLGVFFNKEYEDIADLYSYGHDIEASWLVDRATEALREPELATRIGEIDLALAKTVRQAAMENGALNNQKCRGEVDKTRVWWVQCEGILGFLNAYRKTGESVYLETAVQLWDYIKKYLIDPRPGSEWFWDVNEHGRPESRKNIVEPWKCPYHNGRMCMEVYRLYEHI